MKKKILVLTEYTQNLKTTVAENTLRDNELFCAAIKVPDSKQGQRGENYVGVFGNLPQGAACACTGRPVLVLADSQKFNYHIRKIRYKVGEGKEGSKFELDPHDKQIYTIKDSQPSRLVLSADTMKTFGFNVDFKPTGKPGS